MLTGLFVSVDARVLFERVLADKKFTPDIVRPLWETWSHYESQYGNLERAFTLENRMAIIYPLGDFRYVHLHQKFC